jgi:DHA1 family inner membrane transport protein
MPVAVFVLGLAVFSLGTTEFMIAGLLPELSAAFAVSLPAAGALISLFALGVVVGAPTVTMVTARIPRKTTLVALLTVFVAGEVLAASASNYGVLLFARVVTAVSHGAFFGTGAVVAARLVDANRRARALSVMFGGLTIATVAGVPAGAFIGQHWVWRMSFLLVAVLAAISLVGVVALVPRLPEPEQVGWRGEFAAFGHGKVWLALLTTMLSQAALYATFTYIAPLLTEVTGFSPSLVPGLLVLFGVGTFLGSVFGGRLADRHLMGTLCAGLLVLGGILSAFTFAARSPVAMVVAVFVFGVVSFLINPALQTRVMNEAGDSSTVVSSANISAFNVGNALGPWLGGLTIGAGFGYLSPSWVGVVLAVAALATALLGAAWDRRADSRLVTPQGRERSEMC